MNDRRDIRRLAMQAMYLIDMRELTSADALVESLDDEFDALAPRQAGAALALQAWSNHGEADRLINELAPAWPTHRQPPVDRAILRLAYYEMTSGHVPVKVAINEAVELAKVYGAKQAPNFVNGVLDKLAKRLPSPPEAPPPPPPPPESNDSWLADAVDPPS